MFPASLRRYLNLVCFDRPNLPKTSRAAALSIAALCIFVGGTARAAWASSATTTTLAVTSGGSAVTTVASGITITLTATVASGNSKVSPGQVDFCDATAKYCTDIHLLGMAQLTSAGTATLKFVPGIGSHSYKAVFLGTGSNASSASGTSALTVNGTGSHPTTTSITQTGSAGNYTLTATVTSKFAVPAALTGTISFIDTTNSNYGLASATLEPSATELSILNSDSLATGDLPWSIATGDFNGDGISDLAVANYGGNTVSIFLGKGDGTFNPVNSSVTVEGDGVSIVVGDFNGDGKADLAMENGYYNGVVTILLGNGDGTFAPAPGSPIPVGGTFEVPGAVAVGDFNGDGIPDLVATNGNNVTSDPGTMIVLLGNGNGTFTQATNGPVTVGSSPLSISVGDLNGDGISDLAIANFKGNNVTILLGNGNGTFTPATNSPISVGSFPTSISIGDFNGDGNLDLAVLNSEYTSGTPGTVTVLLGNGDGTFMPAAGSPVTVGYDPWSVAVGDFNEDGNVDLAVANNGDDTVTILLGNGTGAFTPSANGPTPVGGFPQSLVAGDFDESGISDLAVVSYGSSTATVLLTQLTQSATGTSNGISITGTGAHLVNASYPGDPNYAASVSGTTALTAQPVATVLTLNANPASTGLGQQAVLTATLTPSLSQNHSASGAVTFLNGTTNVGSGTISSGVATLSLTSLPLGTDSLTATYAGDTNFAGSTSLAVTETVVAPDYSITANPASLTIPQGGSGTVAFTITPVGGFSQSMTLACAGLPANSTCTFSPAAVTPSGSPVTSTLTIATNVNAQAATLPQSSKNGWLALALPIGPAGFASFFGLLGIRSRNRKDGKRKFTNMLLILGAVTLAIAVAGCGSGGSQATTPTGPVTPTGTSTVTVTASTTASGGPSHSSTLTLIIAN